MFCEQNMQSNKNDEATKVVQMQSLQKCGSVNLAHLFCISR